MFLNWNSLPSDILEIALDEDQMRKEINIAISNIYGYRPVLFEPYMVFENIVKDEIERMKAPVLKCIDSVVGELTSAVRISTQHVSDVWNFFTDFMQALNSYYILN